MGESAKNVQAHWLEAFSHLGHLQQIKTDNGPGYTAGSTEYFLQRWGIQQKTGIPYNPSGQAIVERAHHTFKTLLNKQRRGNQETSSRNLIMLAMCTYNFLNCDNYLNISIEKHFNLQNLNNKGPHHLVLYRDPWEKGNGRGWLNC